MKWLIILIWLVLCSICLNITFDMLTVANTVQNYIGIFLLFFIVYFSYKVQLGIRIYNYLLNKIKSKKQL